MTWVLCMCMVMVMSMSVDVDGDGDVMLGVDVSVDDVMLRWMKRCRERSVYVDGHG